MKCLNIFPTSKGFEGGFQKISEWQNVSNLTFLNFGANFERVWIFNGFFSDEN